MKLAVFEKILSLAEKAVWGLPTLLLLVGVGVYLTVRTRFFPVPHISSDAKAYARRNLCTEKG